jgi:hypothetical protein
MPGWRPGDQLSRGLYRYQLTGKSIVGLSGERSKSIVQRCTLLSKSISPTFATQPPARPAAVRIVLTYFKGDLCLGWACKQPSCQRCEHLAQCRRPWLSVAAAALRQPQQQQAAVYTYGNISRAHSGAPVRHPWSNWHTSAMHDACDHPRRCIPWAYTPATKLFEVARHLKSVTSPLQARRAVTPPPSTPAATAASRPVCIPAGKYAGSHRL